MNVQATLEEIHKKVARVSGEMATSIARKMGSKRAIQQWSRELKESGMNLDKLTEKLK